MYSFVDFFTVVIKPNGDLISMPVMSRHIEINTPRGRVYGNKKDSITKINKESCGGTVLLIDKNIAPIDSFGYADMGNYEIIDGVVVASNRDDCNEAIKDFLVCINGEKCLVAER